MNEASTAKDALVAGNWQAAASFAELTERRRGRIRRYLYEHPRVMDAVVALSYILLVAPTAVDALVSGKWLAAALLGTVAGALFLRRFHPVGLVAFVAVMEVAVTLLHPGGPTCPRACGSRCTPWRWCTPGASRSSPWRQPPHRSPSSTCWPPSGPWKTPSSRTGGQPGGLPPAHQHRHRCHHRTVQRHRHGHRHRCEAAPGT